MSDTLEFLQRILKKKGLEVVGYFNPDRSDSVCPTIRTIILIGTKEPHFWNIFKKSKEYRENKKDPLDSWSKKILQKIALNFDAKPFFPFEAPFQPFIAWAKECNTMSSSPVGLLVHNKKGLFISFRGALGIYEYIKSPNDLQDVCNSCEKPCLTVCPVNALNQNGYDAARCKDYLNTPDGKDCKDGCLVRRSCPVGRNLRQKEQSNFHMSAFLSE